MRFVVVYKTGGDYSEEDVNILFRQVRRFCPLDIDFTVLTDSEKSLRCDTRIKLTDDLPGWWSIIEAFKL